MSDLFTTTLPADFSGIYATIRDSNGLVYNTDTAEFEAYTTGNEADYSVAMVADDSGMFWSASFPAGISAGFYNVSIFDSDDTPVGSGQLQWDGTDIVPGVDLSSLESDIAELSAKLTSQRITVVQPALQGSVLTIIDGDDYIDDRALTWTTTSAGQWSDLTSATIKLTIKKQSSNINPGIDSDEFDGVVVQATGNNKSVSVSLSNEQTSALACGTSAYIYRLWATLSGGAVITLSTGTINVVEPAVHVEEEA